jgi:hypothetical protein
MEQRQKEIRELALKIFKRRLGFMFKSNVEPEVIDKLVDSEPFQEYIEEATLQYDKRQQALEVNKSYPVVAVPKDGRRGMSGGAYVLAFVYSKYKGNVVVKGYMREVEDYIKKNFTHYFVNYSLWYMGSHRDIWYFWKKDVGIHTPTKSSKKEKIKKDDRVFKVRPRCDYSWDVSEEEYKKQHKDADENQLVFKRMPKRWIPEFDKF